MRGLRISNGLSLATEPLNSSVIKEIGHVPIDGYALFKKEASLESTLCTRMLEHPLLGKKIKGERRMVFSMISTLVLC
jgi:hypothetical protein